MTRCASFAFLKQGNRSYVLVGNVWAGLGGMLEKIWLCFIFRIWVWLRVWFCIN